MNHHHHHLDYSFYYNRDRYSYSYSYSYSYCPIVSYRPYYYYYYNNNNNNNNKIYPYPYYNYNRGYNAVVVKEEENVKKKDDDEDEDDDDDDDDEDDDDDDDDDRQVSCLSVPESSLSLNDSVDSVQKEINENSSNNNNNSSSSNVVIVETKEENNNEKEKVKERRIKRYHTSTSYFPTSFIVLQVKRKGIFTYRVPRKIQFIWSSRTCEIMNKKKVIVASWNASDVRQVELHRQDARVLLVYPKNVRPNQSHNENPFILQFNSPITAEDCQDCFYRFLNNLPKKIVEREVAPVTIYCGTFNMGDAPMVEDEHTIRKFIPHECEDYDIITIGVQECRYKTSPNQTDENSETCGSHWRDTVVRHVGKKHELVKYVNLMNIRLCVFAKKSLLPLLQSVKSSNEATGIGHVMGNKGGAVVSFGIHDFYFCFVNSHLAAHQQNTTTRNDNYREIINGTVGIGPYHLFDILSQHQAVFWMGDLNYRIDLDRKEVIQLAKQNNFSKLYEHDQLKKEMEANHAFLGFTTSKPNFPPTYKYDRYISDTSAAFVTTSYASASSSSSKDTSDENSYSTTSGINTTSVTSAAINSALASAVVSFPATTPAVVAAVSSSYTSNNNNNNNSNNNNNNNIDNSGGIIRRVYAEEKQRIPAYTDRILYKVFPGIDVEELDYNCVDAIQSSDHSPVYGIYRVNINKQSRNQADTNIRIFFKNLAAKGLKPADLDGLADPYLAMIVTGRYSTRQTFADVGFARRATKRVMKSLALQKSVGMLAISDTKYNTLEPNWDSEECPEIIFSAVWENIIDQHILVAVIDRDIGSADDIMGYSVIPLDVALCNELIDVPIYYNGLPAGNLTGEMCIETIN